MIVLDANVLLYSVNRAAPRHQQAKRFLEVSLNGGEPIAFTWDTLLAFLRIVTLTGLTERPLPVTVAFEIMEDWLASPAATMVGPTSRHFGIIRGLLLESGTAGNLTSDAHLAAIAIENGARVCTFDRDFARFAGPEWFTPT